jgi:hypothetical protein
MHLRSNLTSEIQTMAENTKNQNSAAQNGSNGSTPPLACEMVGCVLHLEGQVTSSGKDSTSPKELYKFRVHFRTQKEIEFHARESVGRVVQYRARTGKPIPIRDDGSFVDVYTDMSFAKTYDDVVKEHAAMTPEALERRRRELQMELDALQKKQSTSHASAKMS